MNGPILSRRNALGVFGLGAAAAVTGCGSSVGGGGGGGSSSGGGRSVKVGLIIPQDGVYTPLGLDMKNAWDLYLDQNDGMLGGYEVETIVGDEGESPDTGVPAVSGLLQRDQVDVLVGLVNSATALGSVEVVAAAKKLLIVANAGANAITAADTRNPYIWRTSFTNSQISNALGTYLAEQNVPGGVYLMAADYAGGQEHAAAFRSAFLAAGGSIAGEAFTPFGTTQDFQPFLSGIQGTGAGATYVFYAGGEAVSYVQQYASFGIKDSLPLYGSGFLTEGGVLPAQGEAALGVQTTLHYTSELDNEANSAFVEAYQAAYEDAIPTCYSVQTWDAALVLDQILADVDALDGDTLSEAMAGLGEISDSPRGAWSFNGQTPEQTIYLREVTESGGALVNSVKEDLGTVAQPG